MPTGVFPPPASATCRRFDYRQHCRVFGAVASCTGFAEPQLLLLLLYSLLCATFRRKFAMTENQLVYVLIVCSNSNLFDVSNFSLFKIWYFHVAALIICLMKYKTVTPHQ